MWFRALFAVFQACPLCLKTLVLGTVLGRLSGVPSEVRKRTFPKHTLEGAYGYFGAQKVILGLPEGSHLEAKFFKTES